MTAIFKWIYKIAILALPGLRIDVKDIGIYIAYSNT